MLVSIPVEDVMTPDVVRASPAERVSAVADRLRTLDIGSVVVVRDDEPVGIVTDTDLIGILADGLDPESITVEEYMSSPLRTVEPETPIERAAELMRTHDITRLPVIEDGAVVGIVTATDISYYIPLVRVGRPHGARAELEFEGGGMAYDAEEWEFEFVDKGGVGNCVRFRKRITESDVEAFAHASGDTNRLHLDDAFAAETRFGQRIAHGTLVAGLISAALARIPGLTIYLSQDLSFLKPVPLETLLTVVCEVVEDLGDRRYRLTTVVYDETETMVIDGEATVLVDPLPAGYDRSSRD